MKPVSERRQILLLCLFLALLLGSGCAGYLLRGGGQSNKIAGGEQTEKRAHRLNLGAPYFYVLPEITVALRTGRCRAPHVSFILAAQASEHLESLIDSRRGRLAERITAHVQTYQRQSLLGAKGADMMRADMAAVINGVIAPARIQKVYFSSFTLH
ncbi:MAG: flagellar basal body-associated FliL family protein [Rhodospirillales bacterium]